MDAMGASAASLQQYDNSNNTLKGNAIAEGNAKKPAAVGVVMALASAREVNIEMPIHALRCLAHRDGGALPSPCLAQCITTHTSSDAHPVFTTPTE